MPIRIWQRLDLKLHPGRWATIIVLYGGAQGIPIIESERQSVPVRMVLRFIMVRIDLLMWHAGRSSSLTVYLSPDALKFCSYAVSPSFS